MSWTQFLIHYITINTSSRELFQKRSTKSKINEHHNHTLQCEKKKPKTFSTILPIKANKINHQKSYSIYPSLAQHYLVFPPRTSFSHKILINIPCIVYHRQDVLNF